MKIEKIKPIPKYILKLIAKADKSTYKGNAGTTRYYSYFTKNDGELVCVSVAVKEHNKQRYYKQVVVHGLRSTLCFIKDIAFHYLAGYITGWHEEGIAKEKYWEDGSWGDYYGNYFHLDAPVVNADYIKKFPKYKYSQIENYHDRNPLQYLRLYEEYPQIELLMKFGLQDYVIRKSILNKTSKDKSFGRWLIKHSKEITSCRLEIHANTLIRAYTKNADIIETQQYLNFKNSLTRDYRLKPIGKLFKGDKAVERLVSYLQAKDIGVYTYADYIHACNYLQIDLTEEKNLIPHDFKRWHDERLEQERILRAENHRKWLIEEKKRQAKREREQKAAELKRQKELSELETKFLKVVKRFARLQNCEQNDYVIFIAKSPAELIIEGQQLKHCVGGENYRLRMSKAESLIFFVREIAEPDKPFVTVEYSPKKQKVLQCYGYNDIPPADNVKHFVNDIWLPYANATTNRIMRRKAA